MQSDPTKILNPLPRLELQQASNEPHQSKKPKDAWPGAAPNQQKHGVFLPGTELERRIAEDLGVHLTVSLSLFQQSKARGFIMHWPCIWSQFATFPKKRQCNCLHHVAQIQDMHRDSYQFLTCFDASLLATEHNRNKAGKPSQEIDLRRLHTAPEVRWLARIDGLCARRAYREAAEHSRARHGYAWQTAAEFHPALLSKPIR